MIKSDDKKVDNLMTLNYSGHFHLDALVQHVVVHLQPRHEGGAAGGMMTDGHAVLAVHALSGEHHFQVQLLQGLQPQTKAALQYLQKQNNSTIKILCFTVGGAISKY
jgi:hypothetical protein